MPSIPETANFSLLPETLQRELVPVIELLTRHLQGLEERAVKPAAEPGAFATHFSPEAPSQSLDLAVLLRTLSEHILPSVTHWQHPRFFAYYPSTASIPAIVSELIIATLGSVGLQWSANPAGTELECIVMDWIMKLLHAKQDSPFLHSSKRGGGVIQNTAGEAIAVIMVAARIEKHRLLAQGTSQGPLTDEQRERLFWQDSSSFVVYTSDHTHFSGPKAVRVAGMRLHKIAAQKLAHGNYGINAAQVKSAMEQDRAQGLRPCAVLLNYGSTNTCGWDDLESFLEFREDEQVWVHVDAAYAGSSLILPEYKERSQILQDIATSFNFNGSKWFLCGFDSAFLFIRDRNLLKNAFAAGAEYMADAKLEEVYNPEFKDWSIPLGRRFRSLRIWLVLSYFGRSGLENYLRQTIAAADWFRRKISESSFLEEIVTTELGLVCFTLKSNEADETDRFLSRLEAISRHGETFLIYPSQLGHRRFLRLAIGSVQTKIADLELLWLACLEAYQTR